jgi:hypothetical protein
MTPRTYASPEAFKQALEQRLRTSAMTGAEFARGRPVMPASPKLTAPMAKNIASKRSCSSSMAPPLSGTQF